MVVINPDRKERQNIGNNWHQSRSNLSQQISKPTKLQKHLLRLLCVVVEVANLSLCLPSESGGGTVPVTLIISQPLESLIYVQNTIIF